MSPTIQVQHLSKTYQVPEREGGFGAAVRSFFKRKYKEVKAVQQVDFTIEQGEVVGFLGPNGAGKTTTLKMLSGLLHPTGGSANVLGFTPWELKPEYLRSMTLVMGQRNRLSWDIPAADSFLLNQAIYRIPDDEYKETYKELDELLELEPLMKKPVRNLSLGERMKCEIAAGLLHRPKVLFLDEPTIGLDITGQSRIREFLREYNKRTGATILLTSHYMADVTALCERIIIIHHGQLKYDGGINDLSKKIAPFKLIGVMLADADAHDLSKYGEVVQNEEDAEKRYIQVKAEEVTHVTSRLLADLPIRDITIADPPIEDVIEQAFNA
ncbi:MAG: ATP-binding cassette domain-containing protein [Anaerolineales bacterium]|uniref:ABC transporter ATP-binding protein n=1 Tax=Candidatus Villigracilis vicinus TaxID=3140679 RepID=UPI0031359210|nr:ATP-binding cassette domain-containing protein [Anaerolineales bacterium]MBK7448837.1 ATP-binding cassette domain-containing protein [Anaerolineales bacterium]MBK9778601.1 ATP-binding cassette domain-containing protein [Anaerolineales bacterium]